MARILVLTVVATLFGACTAPLFVKDCGSADQRVTEFVEIGRDCLWSAYLGGEAAKWTMTRATIEGDPIPYTVVVTREAIEVMQDTSADKFGGPSRGRTTWRCSAMTKVQRSVGSFQFAFSGCTGTAVPPSPL